MLIDTHCHLNFPDKFPDPEGTIAEAEAAGVGKLIVIGCDTESSQAAVRLADQFDTVYAVVGWHPTYVQNLTDTSLQEIEVLLEHPKVVAVGEIGLDFHWDYSTPEQQYPALEAQLEMAVRAGKPVVFHCRDAYPQLLDILEQRPVRPYLLHCFGGTLADANRAMALGAIFGVDGPITYKNANSLREIVAEIPLDRWVVETDSPYMPPTPHRGQPNRPAYVTYINAALAEVHGVTAERCAEVTTAAATRFFRLD